jgi:putative colanic acid biosynthesis acetyltransferase WcaF
MQTKSTTGGTKALSEVKDVSPGGPAPRMTFKEKAAERVGVILFNNLVTYIPSHTIRLATLRFFGAKIGKKSSILMGSTVLGIRGLNIGTGVGIGFRCLLDARGGLEIRDHACVASDVQFIAGHHLPNSDTFDYILGRIVIGEHSWIASRATVLANVTIGRGAIVGAVSLVRKDVAEMEIVAGVPAIHRGVRESALNYSPGYRPLFF